MIRVLIVEDQALFADAVRSSLVDLGVEVVGACAHGGEAVDLARAFRPEVALVDLGLPGESGIVVGRRLLEASPETKVVALTALEGERLVREAVAAGFHGFLTKDIPIRQLVRSIHSVLDGQIVLSRSPRRDSVMRLGDSDRDILAGRLTARELEVLHLLADGASGDRIAELLSISNHTVRTHVQNVLIKLQVHSRLEAAAFAIRHGIVRAGLRPLDSSDPAA